MHMYGRAVMPRALNRLGKCANWQVKLTSRVEPKVDGVKCCRKVAKMLPKEDRYHGWGEASRGVRPYTSHSASRGDNSA